MIEGNSFQLSNYPTTGDIRFDEKSGTRKRFNGLQWRALCRVENCPMTSGIYGLCGRHQHISVQNKKNINEETLSNNYLNNKNVNKKTSLNSRPSRELKTIVAGQTFLWEQHEREGVAQKRFHSDKDDNEPSIKQKKISSSSSEIEEVIERINEKLIHMHKNVDRIIHIRNSILSSFQN